MLRRMRAAWLRIGPFAAAVATIPVVIVLLYLLAVRRSGALDQL